MTISEGSKTFSFRCCAMPIIIITLMPMFTMYRVKVKQIILFGKIVNQYFERKESFSIVPVLKFWWRFCENQGREKSVLVSCSFKAYCKLHRLPFTWLHLIMDIRVPGKWKKPVTSQWASKLKSYSWALIWLSVWCHHLTNLHTCILKTLISLVWKEIIDNSKQHFSSHTGYLFMF